MPDPTDTETPAETIRRAAQLMRERANFAGDGPWAADVRPGGQAWIDVIGLLLFLLPVSLLMIGLSWEQFFNAYDGGEEKKNIAQGALHLSLSLYRRG